VPGEALGASGTSAAPIYGTDFCQPEMLKHAIFFILDEDKHKQAQLVFCPINTINNSIH
jgi:hypothetical protein